MIRIVTPLALCTVGIASVAGICLAAAHPGDRARRPGTADRIDKQHGRPPCDFLRAVENLDGVDDVIAIDRGLLQHQNDILDVLGPSEQTIGQGSDFGRMPFYDPVKGRIVSAAEPLNQDLLFGYLRHG